jgi:hypothetical protein
MPSRAMPFHLIFGNIGNRARGSKTELYPAVPRCRLRLLDHVVVEWRNAMKNIFAAVTIITAIAVTPTVVGAQERLGDGAMGAAAGALVFGPVGAVAGGLVGYTAGPDIARSWGLKRHHHRHHHYAAQDRNR